MTSSEYFFFSAARLHLESNLTPLSLYCANKQNFLFPVRWEKINRNECLMNNGVQRWNGIGISFVSVASLVFWWFSELLSLNDESLVEDKMIVIYSIKKWSGNYFNKIIVSLRLCNENVFILFSDMDSKWWISMLLLTTSFVTWAEENKSEWYSKLVVVVVSFSRDEIVYKYSSTMFQQTIYFVMLAQRNGRARMKEAEDICRQSTSRQMSDNAIVWWVWMTGSFVSFLFRRRLFSFSSTFAFSREMSGKWQLEVNILFCKSNWFLLSCVRLMRNKTILESEIVWWETEEFFSQSSKTACSTAVVTKPPAL